MELERRAFLYYSDFVATRARRFSSRDEKAVFDEIAADPENIIASLDAAIAREELAESAALAIDLIHYWVVRGFAVQGQERLNALLERADVLPAKTRVDLLNAAARIQTLRGEIVSAKLLTNKALELAALLGDDMGQAEALYGSAKCAFSMQSFEDAEADLDRALAIFARVGDRVRTARALDLRGQFADARGAGNEASTFFRRSLSTYESLGDLFGIATVKYHLGFSALTRAEYDAAVALNTEAMNAWRDYGHVEGQYLAQHNLASAELAMGRLLSASRLYVDCVRSAHRYGFRRELFNGLDRLAEILEEKDSELAVRCLAYAAAGRKRSGYAVLVTDRFAYDACLQRLRKRLSPDGFASQWNLGSAAEEDQLVASLWDAIGTEL